MRARRLLPTPTTVATPVKRFLVNQLFCIHFQQTGDIFAISAAITALRIAVKLRSRHHKDLPLLLSVLGGFHLERFRKTGRLSDIDEGISLQLKAVTLTPHSHPNLPSMLSNLGNLLFSRFKRIGEPSYADVAIEAHQKAVELTPDGAAVLPELLNNLGVAFRCRFERSGELADIAEAISAQQKAVKLIPQDHTNLPFLLGNLGNSFDSRFERTGDLSDIAEAISVQQKAVELAPQGHAHIPTLLGNLGTCYLSRFERTGEIQDIVEAISAQKKAVELTPPGDAGLPERLNNLGISLTCRYERTGELPNIAEAISTHREGVDLTSEDDAGLPVRLSNLGKSLRRRFEQTFDPSDLADAIAVQQKAVTLTPLGHADRSLMLHDLGKIFHCRFVLHGESSDLDESISSHKAAAISSSGSPRVRLEAAKTWADLATQHNHYSSAIVPAFDTAIGLLAEIAGLEQTVQGRYTQLETSSGLATMAAAAACALGRTDKAVEWLEQGRCLVWTQLSDLRTPINNLQAHDSVLAQRVADISKQLEMMASSRGTSHIDMSFEEKVSLEDEARAHLDLARQWKDLLETVRAIPEFESFLAPSACSTLLRHLPETGPVIVINVHESRCDAIALLSGREPLHIPLPNFSIEKTSKYRAILNSALQSQHLRVREADNIVATSGQLSPARDMRPAPVEAHRYNPSVHLVLRGLWEEVVKPVLDALGIPKTAEGSKRITSRVWWCPTGPLSFLPLHAAGKYGGPNSEATFDYVISSYTPSISAITDRVKNTPSIDNPISGLLLTCQPTAPGASPIPGTTNEVESILKGAKRRGVRALMLQGDEMTAVECLKQMQKFSSIHLACHGSQNASEPLRSRFLFHQGSLELGEILKSNLKHADLAYLSACQTGTGEEGLPDEAVHLAAGMLSAGYQQVVGTMWSIRDRPAQMVAVSFYEFIFTSLERSSDTLFNGTDSAYALHQATQKLRHSLDDSEYSLLTWVPFVHYGL
ncbi:hypothetical protein D9611_010754 [Ephemerocybe angulata]|uniref:CHAT domain-containing protein n=1 Tax=Ephemerocybe angulata TaxID=980116 RepID=A0A8H5BCK9_9AGAR|nr:hypothetical protein D9611_010754 [Tulosesus angulatus]